MTTESLRLYWKEYRRKKRLDPEYREKENKKQQLYRLQHPEKTREQSRLSEQKRRLKRYGISKEEYNNLLDSQGHCCAICDIELTDDRFCHVDHSHDTGKVRGILCHHCNFLLGNAKDSLAILSSAYSYLEKSLD